MNPALVALINALMQQRAGERQAMPATPKWTDRFSAWAQNNYAPSTADLMSQLALEYMQYHGPRRGLQPPRPMDTGGTVAAPFYGQYPAHDAQQPMYPPMLNQPMQELHAWRKDPSARNPYPSKDPNYASLYGDM